MERKGISQICTVWQQINLTRAVLRNRIRIHRIHMFLGLLDPDSDPLVRGMDLDTNHSIMKQK